MAVEYEISSDVATIKDVAPNTQVARVVSLYSGQITYDDEAGSKFATATINGKSQRVMLCIAVNGTVNYDGVPSLYSTVDGHRCLNIVSPTETGTPDDVPSVNETVVIDGKNVRAVRCILINATPVYDGVSSVCTFTGDDGKTHTAQLVNKISGGAIEIIVKGVSPISLPDAIADSLEYLKAFGGTHQGLPSGYDPVNFIYFLDGAYLQTDIVPTYDGKVEMDFTATASPASAYLLGGRNSGAGGGMFFAVNGNKFFLDAFGSASSDRYSSNIAPVSNTRYKFTFNNKVATLESGGTTLFTNTFTGTEANGAKLCINGLNSNGTITGGGQIGIYLYSFKVWDNQGKLIANYVPCAKTNPLTVGLYDLVTDTFINAPTSGTWAAGPAAGASVNPTPDAPIDIVSNNGVLKASTQLFVNGNLANGTTNWSIETLTYTDTADYAQFYNASGSSVYLRCTPPTRIAGHKYAYLLKAKNSGGTTPWGARNGTQLGLLTTTETMMAGIDTFPSGGSGNPWLNIPANTTIYVNKSSGFRLYDLTALGLDNTITTAEQAIAYFGDTYTEPGEVYADGTVETIRVSGNLVDFNETRINGTTWASADKTKGFEVEAAVYAKSVGSSVIGNPNCFGVFVPCSQGKSVSINFFDYAVYGARCFCCEVDADGKATTAPVQYATNQNVLTQQTFTITQPDSIGFVIEWYITSAQERNYTKENYTVVAGTTPPTQYTQFNICTATCEDLLSIGTYTDQQEIIDGTVTRKVGVKVFDGTENWGAGSAQNPNRFTLAGAFSDIAQIPDENVGYSNCYTVIARSSSIQSNLQNNECGWNTTYVFCVRDDRFDTVAQFTAWLASQYNAGTPVIIVYPLATPTTESVTGQPMQVQQGDNFVEITQASLDNLEIEAKYQAAVSLTIQEVQDANLDPNVQVTIN